MFGVPDRFLISLLARVGVAQGSYGLSGSGNFEIWGWRFWRPFEGHLISCFTEQGEFGVVIRNSNSWTSGMYGWLRRGGWEIKVGLRFFGTKVVWF